MGDLDNKIIVGWAIEENIQDETAWSLPSIPKAQYVFTDAKHQWRQWTSECVLYSVIWCVADNTLYDFTTKDIDELKSMLPDYWRDIDNWMYLTKWWDLVVDRFSKKWRKLKKVTIQTYTDDFLEVLDKWYSVQFGSKIWKEYINDINTDWDIDIEFKWSTWHARRIFKDLRKDSPTYWLYYIVENFLWSLKYNVIEVTPLMMHDLLSNGKMFYQSFIYYFEPVKSNWREKAKKYWDKYIKNS